MTSAPAKAPFHLESARALVVAGVVLVLAVLAAATAQSVRHEYQAEVAQILSASDRTALKLAARTTEVFDRVNQATLLVKYLAENRPLPALASLRRAGVISDDIVQFFYVTDRRGFVVDTTAGLSALNVADEVFFKRHHREGDLDVLISPAAADPITGHVGIPVTRRLGADRAFDGMAVAAVNPAALSVEYAKTEARGTAIGVLGADGVFLSRTVDGVHSFGVRSDPARLLQRSVEIHQSGTPLKSPIDGILRFVSVVKVEKYPLYAVVAVDAEHALAGYRSARDQAVTWAVMVGAGAIVAGWMLLAQARRLDGSRRRAKKAEAAFRATLEGSLDSVAILEARYDAAGVLQGLLVVDCNSLAAALIGLDRSQMLGRDLCELTPSLRSGGFLKSFDDVVRNQRSIQAEIQATDPAVAGRWLHHQLVPLEGGVAFITRDVTAKRTAEAALASLARTDSLTRLANRRHFDDILQAATARATRSGQTLALLYIDLDGFKSINDTLGHAAGDTVLTGVAERLLATVRATDAVGRLGGDEFAVVAEGAGSADDVVDLCGRVVDALRQPRDVAGTVVVASASVGVAVLCSGESAPALCARADAAMYEAKALGKSRYFLADRQHGDGVAALAPQAD